jgi:hypothetical protein
VKAAAAKARVSVQNYILDALLDAFAGAQSPRVRKRIAALQRPE